MTPNAIVVLAGAISSFMLMTSTLPMVFKAIRTKDLRSYSTLQIVLSNIGNGLYWLYVLSLPPGPIWALHGFHTLTTGLMLVLYLRYEAPRQTRAAASNSSIAK